MGLRLRRIELGLLFLIAGTVATSGCASALRKPPPLADMAAKSRAAQGRFSEAERLWNLRSLDSVRSAAESYQAAITQEAVQLEALLGATRARLWLADHEEDAHDRLAAVVEAINLAQWCGRVDPQEPQCDYLLALGLGLQVRERRATAIDGLPRVVSLLKSSIERSPEMDHAGPHRVMALVYLRAPSWPAGPGDIDLGYEQAQRATQLDPAHPPNQLALGEALGDVGEISSSKAAYREAERLALEQLGQGVPDASEWLDLARAALAKLEQR